MAGPRNPVPPPGFVARNFGLLTVVQARFDEQDDHWQNGVTYQSLCGIGGTTYNDYCVTGNPAPRKGPNVTTPVRGATPFTAIAEVDCSAVGYSADEARAKAAQALTQTEGWQVERTFWTGGISVTGAGALPAVTTTVYPHLAANTAVFDTGVLPTTLLQPAAIAVTGSTVVDIVEGIGYLEQAMATCYNGQPVLHLPVVIIEQGFRAGILKVNGSHIETMHGSLVAAGGGYPGTGPDGTSLPGAVWAYATGQVFAYRSSIFEPQYRESIDRSTNTVKMIAERTYVLGWDCCLFAVPISVGGIVTGAVGAPN